MDEKIYYLIYGGAISLISSAITMILNLFVNFLESKRKRKWDQDDRRREKKEKILMDNITQAEKLVLEIVSWHSTIPEKIEFFLDSEMDFSKYITEMKPLLNTIYLSPVFEIIENEKLSAQFDKLGLTTQKLMEIIPIMQAKLNQNEITRDKAGEIIFNMSMSASEPFHEIMKILNKLKIEIMTT
jgi:hypothetical protein